MKNGSFGTLAGVTAPPNCAPPFLWADILSSCQRWQDLPAGIWSWCASFFWARTDICLFYPWWSGPLRLTTHKHIIHSQHDTLTERLSRLDMLVVISVTSHHGQRIQRLWNKDRFLQLYASLTALHCFPIMPPCVLLEWEGGSKQTDLSALRLFVFFNDEVFGYKRGILSDLGCCVAVLFEWAGLSLICKKIYLYNIYI